MKEVVYIEFLNKEKNFRLDRIEFETIEEAINWGSENLEKFRLDFIKFDYK